MKFEFEDLWTENHKKCCERIIESTKITCNYTFYVKTEERDQIFWLARGQNVIPIWTKIPLLYEPIDTRRSKYAKFCNAIQNVIMECRLVQCKSENTKLPSYLFLDKLITEGIVSVKVFTTPRANNWLTERNISEKITMGWNDQYCTNVCQPNWIYLKQIIKGKLDHWAHVLKKYEVQMDLKLYDEGSKELKIWQVEFVMSEKPDKRPTYYSYTELPGERVRKSYSHVEFVQLCYEFLIQNVAGKEFRKIQINDFLEAQPHFRIDPGFMVIFRIYNQVETKQ